MVGTQQAQNSQKASLASAISGFGEAKGWRNTLDELRQNGKIMLYSNLVRAKAIELNDMTVGISFPDGINAFGRTILEKPESISELSKSISMQYGKEMKVKIIESIDALPKKEQSKETEIKNAMGDLDIPINIIE